jgi:SnoaL-like domain
MAAICCDRVAAAVGRRRSGRSEPSHPTTRPLATIRLGLFDDEKRTRMEMDLQGLHDRLEIHELLARYARGVDSRDWDLWKTVFTPDAVLDYSSVGIPVGSR